MNEVVNININDFDQEIIMNIYLKKKHTYDIQVQDAHHYILENGIVSHNSSIFAGQVSNGIEPVFMKEYTRWVVMTDQQKQSLQQRHYSIQYESKPDSVQVQEQQYQKIPNPQLGQWWQTCVFKFAERGNEQILRGEIDGVIYEIDKNRGLIKPMQVMDYGWKYVKEHQLNDSGVVQITDLSVDDHINMLATSAKYINQNQSKTINIPKDYKYQDFKEVYFKAWQKKIKGVTTYRDGTMTAVIQKKSKNKHNARELEQLFTEKNGTVILSDVKIPDVSYALQYKIKDKYKKKWYFTLSFADKSLTKPFALFIRTNNRQSTQVTDLVIKAMEDLLLAKGIKEQLILEQKEKYSNQTNVDKIGRAIGMALRHNIPIVDIVETLEKYSDGLSTLIFHIKKVLSEYIKDGTRIENRTCSQCGSESLVYQGGCVTCINCGNSKCT